MAKKEVLSPWVLENVPDEAIYGEHYIIVRKEETQSGSRVHVNQTLSEPREGTITGAQVKEHMQETASPVLGISLIVIGLVVCLISFLSKMLEGDVNGSNDFPKVILIFGCGIIIGGIYLVIKSKKSSPEILSISSWGDFEPFLEKALTDKVYKEEMKARQEEMGDKGSGFAGYFCIPARHALSGDLEKAKSNFGLMDQIKLAVINAAANLPEDSRKLVRKISIENNTQIDNNNLKYNENHIKSEKIESIPDTKNNRKKIVIIVLLLITLIIICGIIYIIYSKGTNNEGMVEYNDEKVASNITNKEITDSWEQIIDIVNDGTYKEKYNIGDSKELDLGSEGIIDMQIVAFDTDELADGGGKAAITWISKQLINSDHRMNPEREVDPSDSSQYLIGTGSIGGWKDSEMRNWLQIDVKELIPETVRDTIKPVIKHSTSYTTANPPSEESYINDEISIDDIWIPSWEEVFGSDPDYDVGYEAYKLENISYHLYNSKDTRKRQKVNVSIDDTWWLRSANPPINNDYYNGFKFINVGYTGDLDSSPSYYNLSVLIGFCM